MNGWYFSGRVSSSGLIWAKVAATSCGRGETSSDSPYFRLSSMSISRLSACWTSALRGDSWACASPDSAACSMPAHCASASSVTSLREIVVPSTTEAAPGGSDAAPAEGEGADRHERDHGCAPHEAGRHDPVSSRVGMTPSITCLAQASSSSSRGGCAPKPDGCGRGTSMVRTGAL